MVKNYSLISLRLKKTYIYKKGISYFKPDSIKKYILMLIKILVKAISIG